MTSRVVAALGALKVGKLPHGPVFRNVAGRQMVHNFASCFARIVRRADLVDERGKAGFSVHDLRGSCATELLRRGVAPKTVQRILGHANLTTTMRYYASVQDKDLHNAIARLEQTA